jgi:diadenosine tetraphosphate (Ap4A) HIT family hydrolase
MDAGASAGRRRRVLVFAGAMTGFALAPAFVETSTPLMMLGLCEARLQLDARWPWIVLIPHKNGAREIADLTPEDRARLIEETVRAGDAVRALGVALGRPVEKLNVGALGNITPQLHVHVVGRRADDPAWPGPVWGVGEAAAYEAGVLERALDVASKRLARPIE